MLLQAPQGQDRSFRLRPDDRELLQLHIWGSTGWLGQQRPRFLGRAPAPQWGRPPPTGDGSSGFRNASTTAGAKLDTPPQLIGDEPRIAGLRLQLARRPQSAKRWNDRRAALSEVGAESAALRRKDSRRPGREAIARDAGRSIVLLLGRVSEARGSATRATRRSPPADRGQLPSWRSGYRPGRRSGSRPRPWSSPPPGPRSRP